jgi:hypothetical protein
MSQHKALTISSRALRNHGSRTSIPSMTERERSDDAQAHVPLDARTRAILRLQILADLTNRDATVLEADHILLTEAHDVDRGGVGTPCARHVAVTREFRCW